MQASKIISNPNIPLRDVMKVSRFLENHDVIKATLDSLKDNKDAILKVLTKTNISKVNSLTYAIFKKDPQNFANMLSYVDDSASFSKLIISSGSQQSHSF